jgi:glutamine amidotransferase
VKIVIIDYGAGNIKSIQFAFERLGYHAIHSRNTSEIKNADRVVFPGVGEASNAMRKLKESGLDNLIPSLKQPVLGICLGMQLLCKHSEENDTLGLGVFDLEVRRFKNLLKVPQMGWNTIFNLDSDLFNGLEEQSYMYLVHSYYAELNEDTVASTSYGIEYSTALQKDNFYGVQFHPEKSGTAGEKILKNFIELKCE